MTIKGIPHHCYLRYKGRQQLADTIGSGPHSPYRHSQASPLSSFHTTSNWKLGRRKAWEWGYQPLSAAHMEFPIVVSRPHPLMHAHTLQKYVSCFHHRVVTVVADKLQRRWYWRLTIRQPNWQLPSSSYNHNYALTTLSCEGVITSALSSYSKELSCSYVTRWGNHRCYV